MGRYGYRGDWAPYVPVGERKRLATQEAKSLLKKGQTLAPIQISGSKIATTFWGIAWCENLEKYGNLANRLPRGRTYVRNGSVVDLQINEGHISAVVAGSEPYCISINIKKLKPKVWNQICDKCASSIHSLIDLMRGQLPDAVLQQLTDRRTGIFPTSNEISLDCDCPDRAKLCKHLAAVLYGIGHRLDSEPELFFKLRGVGQTDLISKAVSGQNVDDALGLDQQGGIDAGDLESIFGIELGTADTAVAEKRPTKKRSTKKKAAKKKAPPATQKKKAVKKKATKKKTATAKKAAPAKKSKAAKKSKKKATKKK
ncbi:SWIM zinc finger family protein [Novipirellula sp. SH528]|uniref:SWIM zinc finger family protein n=1 Tax=Novipirellula sp. SH528 TaxID=3454466 RepID=UPI003FA0CF7B